MNSNQMYNRETAFFYLKHFSSFSSFMDIDIVRVKKANFDIQKFSIIRDTQTIFGNCFLECATNKDLYTLQQIDTIWVE